MLANVSIPIPKLLGPVIVVPYTSQELEDPVTIFPRNGWMRVWEKPRSFDRQSGQVKRSASGRDNIWANLLQRDDVIGLGGPEGEGRRCDREHQ